MQFIRIFSCCIKSIVWCKRGIRNQQVSQSQPRKCVIPPIFYGPPFYVAEPRPCIKLCRCSFLLTFSSETNQTSTTIVLITVARALLLWIFDSSVSLSTGVAWRSAVDVFSGVSLFVNTITSEPLNVRWWNLAIGCTVQKSRPSSNSGAIGPTLGLTPGSTPGSPRPKMWRFAESLRKN